MKKHTFLFVQVYYMNQSSKKEVFFEIKLKLASQKNKLFESV